MKRSKAAPKGSANRLRPTQKKSPSQKLWPGQIPYDDLPDEDFLDDVPEPDMVSCAQSDEHQPEPKRIGKRGKA